MKIRIVGHGKEPRFPFGDSGPWKEFEKAITESGNTITNEDFGSQVDALIAHSHSEEAMDEAKIAHVPKEKRILLLWEPEVVDPKRHSAKVISKYGLVFSPSKSWLPNSDRVFFNWPQNPTKIELNEDEWILRKTHAILMQGNKFSARKGELYSLRRHVLLGKFSDRIDLFGPNWNSGFIYDFTRWLISARNHFLTRISLKSMYGLGKFYSNYKGAAEDKSATLCNYKISIVIENSADYISEKLFDSVNSGCVTLYVGPSIESYGIPSGMCIQVAANKEEIEEKLSELFNLSDIELYGIARTQQNSLATIGHMWNSASILRSLALDCLQFLQSH